MTDWFSNEFYRILCEPCARLLDSSLLIFSDQLPQYKLGLHNPSQQDNFLQSCLDFPLSQHITNPTHHTSIPATIIDFILTSNLNICSDNLFGGHFGP